LDDPKSASEAARQLLKYGRAEYALNVLAMELHRARDGLDPGLVVLALQQFRQETDASLWAKLGYEVAALLSFLDESDAIELQRLAELEWAYLPLLDVSRRPARILHRQLARDPQFFVDVLQMAFRAEDEEPGKSDEAAAGRAMLAYRLLDGWRLPPGNLDNGTSDPEAMNAWVNGAMVIARRERRGRIADQQIGRVLTFAPDDPDGAWPNTAVRDLIERVENRDIETGLEMGVFNRRGPTWRGLTEGGAQEREIQTTYLLLAQQLGSRWPRTAAMLRRIATSFGEQARREDEEAQITEDRWQ